MWSDPESRSSAQSTEERPDSGSSPRNTIRILPCGELWQVRHASGLHILFGTRESAEQYAKNLAWVTRPSEIVWLNVAGRECRREIFRRAFRP